MVKIQFQIEGFGKDELATFAAMREGEKPVEENRLWGAVEFSDESGVVVVIKEDLLCIADELFSVVPAALEQHGSAELHFKSWSGQFNFEPGAQRDQIRVTGPVKGSAKVSGVFAKDELIPQLQACGERFTEFVKQLESKKEESLFLTNSPMQDC